MELGKLYYDRCEYSVAIEKLRDVATHFQETRDYDRFLKCTAWLLRMHAERQESEDIRRIKENLQDLVIREGLQLSPKTLYTLGICATYKNELPQALEYFQRAVKAATASDSRADLCYAISGLSICYRMMDRYQDALREIYNLQVFLQGQDLPEIKTSSLMLNAQIFRVLKKFDQAEELLWASYEGLRTERNLLQYVTWLYGMGLLHRDLEKWDLAKMYLQLAQKAADPDSLRHLLSFIEKAIAQVADQQARQQAASTAPDIIFDTGNKSVIERQKGRIDFNNQFVLLDMIKLMLEKPGVVISKENLVQSVWGETYTPGEHDNKIYVAIKRIRKLIEPDFDKPRYVLRAKGGYLFNKAARVRMVEGAPNANV